MSTKKTFESFVNSMNENIDLYKVYKKVSGKYSLRKPSYWGDLFNQRASIPYRELTKYDKELHSLDVYTTKELGCHGEYPMQSNFKVQVPQVFVLYCNTESGELGEYYGMSILVNTEGATYPRYACGMPDFEPELHNFVNGIPESYLNIVTTGAQLLHEQMIVEGQFSWLTNDTNTQIGSEKQNNITVFMYDNNGNKWTEKDYEGYGEFGGMDYYDLVATMNGYTEEDVKTMKGSFKALRQLGIDLAFGKIKTKDKKKKTLFPALVEDPRFNWKRHDFTQEAESDPNQSWYQEEESDDDYDDDYENGWYESRVTEATVVMDAIDPKSKTLKKLLKKYNVKLKVLTMNGPGGGWPEVEMTGSREDLQAILADPNGWDDPELGEYIEESNISEARSINKISKEFGETVAKMKDIVKIYIAAEDGSDEKATTRQQLIDLTQKKKALVKELDDAVAGKNKDVKLVISEGVMSDIHQMIGNHKSFSSFEKEFFKEYGHKKVMKKTPEFLEWLKALYNDFEYTSGEAVEERYTKKSLLKKLGDADDAMIQTGNGKEYIIYNPDSNNDDNAAMWHDKSVFALDQDGEEHEIDYKDIGLVMVESTVTEKLTRGLKPLLTIGSTITKKDGEDALLDLSDKFDSIDDEYAGTIASWLDMAIELMQDGYPGDATKKLKQFNKACKDVLKGKEVGSAFESVTEAKKLKPIKFSVKKSRKNPYTFSDKMDNDELHKLHLHAKAMEFAEKEELDGYKHADYKKAEKEIFDLMMSRGANPYRQKYTWNDDWKEEYDQSEQFVNEAKNDGNLDTIADYVQQVLDDGKSFMDIGKKLKGAYKYDFSTGMMPMYIIPVSGNKIVIINKKYVENGQADRIVGDIAIGLMESLVTESKIQIKRRYTDNHPAQTSGRTAKVRNAMIEALADGILTEEEFNNILKEKSIDNKRWMRRNSKYFTVSENGISLSKYGKRILTGIKPVVSLTLESFISEKANISGAYNDLEHLLGTDMETMDDFQRIENDGTWEEMSDFIEMAGDVEVLRRHKFKSQKDIDKLAKYIMGESVVNEAKFKKGQYIKAKSDSDDFDGDVYDKTNDVDGSEILKNSSFEIYEIGKDEVILWSDADQVEYSIDPDDLKNFVKESVVNEANYIKFKGKKVDISSLEMEDVDMKDYPDFSDAYFSYGEYSNGKEMTDEELSDFTDDNLDLANKLAHESLH